MNHSGLLTQSHYAAETDS